MGVDRATSRRRCDSKTRIENKIKKNRLKRDGPVLFFPDLPTLLLNMRIRMKIKMKTRMKNRVKPVSQPPTSRSPASPDAGGARHRSSAAPASRRYLPRSVQLCGFAASCEASVSRQKFEKHEFAKANPLLKPTFIDKIREIRKN